MTNVFADCELDVLRAHVATWGDGAALESFTLEPRPGASVTSEEELVGRAEHRLGDRLEAGSLPDATVAFDDAGSPWCTICEVRHVDRPGLLALIAAGVATAGASVHAAELIVRDGIAIDPVALPPTGFDGGGGWGRCRSERANGDDLDVQLGLAGCLVRGALAHPSPVECLTEW